MPTRSQFFFFYIDELIRVHWVDWIEGPLTTLPLAQQRHQRGFQEALGDTSAGPRTRAGEAYSLGMLSGRLVKPQTAGAEFPQGWQSVINGTPPATKLGYYAYIIGKALRERPDDPNLVSALNLLATLSVLHISFRHHDRWYTTALVFLFTQRQLEAQLGREITELELRYLAAAVINTLDSDEPDLLLIPYTTSQKIEQLLFDLEDGRIIHFNLDELPEIVQGDEIGVNDFKKTKAALFWSSPGRGIFMRARKGHGANVLDALLKVDQVRSKNGEDNILRSTLNLIESNQVNESFFEIVRDELGDHPLALKVWAELEDRLFDATNKAVETINLSAAPAVWLAAQKHIRFDTSSTQEVDAATEQEEVAIGSASNSSAADLNTTADATGNKKIKLSAPSVELVFSNDSLSDYLESNFADVMEAAPEPSAKTQGTSNSVSKTISKPDYGERDSKNRALGEAGEHFIFEYEKMRLSLAGRDDLAQKVQWVSKELGDGLGYDIVSFTNTGQRLYLEVKTTRGKKAAPFFVSSNEVIVSEEKGDAYRLVRLYGYPTKPRFFILSGSLRQSLQLEATVYRARL